MSSAMIVNATNFNVEKDMKYAKPKVLGSGAKAVNIVNPTSQQVLNLSTPLMLTWGVNQFVDDNTGKKTYDMALQFPGEEYATPSTSQFLENMIKMEAKIKADAVTNSKEWFNKQKMSSEVVDALFHPMLRYPKDPNTGEPDLSRSPTLKLKLQYWDGEFSNTEIYDMDQQMLFGPGKQDVGKSPIELIPKATNVAVVMRCGGIWFANGKFGCTWKLVQAVVKPRLTLAGRCHIQLGADERERLNAQADEDTATTSVAAEDSDDDDDEADSALPASPVVAPSFDEPPPAPKKVVKRKVVRKATKGEDA